MFYDAEAAREAVEELEQEVLAGNGPHVVGPTTMIDIDDESEADEGLAAPDAELMQLIDEAIALSETPSGMTEAFDVPVSNFDPLAELLGEIERMSFPNPFEGLRFDDEPTREEVHALAEELAEEVVAEAIQESAAAQSVSTEEAADEPEGPEETVAALPSGMDPTSKLALAKRALIQARDTLSSVIDLLNDEMLEQNGQELAANEVLKRALHAAGARVIEGVFDGERMVSGDGHQYPVPPNYASKSKLVEGDMLKLTIMPDGKLVYKQIGPTARDRVKGVLACDERGGYCVLSEGARYKVIPASVSFFRGRPGDHVVALVPKGSPSRFAAVDFIVHH